MQRLWCVINSHSFERVLPRILKSWLHFSCTQTQCSWKSWCSVFCTSPFLCVSELVQQPGACFPVLHSFRSLRLFGGRAFTQPALTPGHMNCPGLLPPEGLTSHFVTVSPQFCNSHLVLYNCVERIYIAVVKISSCLES